MQRRHVMVCFIICLTFCIADPVISNAQATRPVTEALLYSISYPGGPLASDRITFHGKKEPFVRGEFLSEDFMSAQIMDTVFGDLNGDHVGDAVVIMAVEFGGSGAWTTFYAVIATEGDPFVSEPVVLGDRVIVKSVRIRSGKIILSVLKHGPKDGACCPSVKKTLTYSVGNGSLVGPSLKGYKD